MKRVLLKNWLFLLVMLAPLCSMAQQITVKGNVTASDDGLGIAGATVKLKGTSEGTVTNSAGGFTLKAAVGNTLVISFIGYLPREAKVTGPKFSTELASSTRTLNELVVTTALGVKRQAKELGFAATNISAKSLTEAHPTNFTNGLTAKVPGLVLSTVDNGINPNTRFTLRGNRHINGNNYALVVLNGVPISPTEVNNINPDDIADVNILNGAGAAALYGSEASNGAMIITTKKGSTTGAPTINYSNTFQAEQISYFPKLQTRFGSYGGEGGSYVDPMTGFITTEVPYENQSYGPAYDGSKQQLGIPAADGTKQILKYQTPNVDPRRAFFQTGLTDQNNLSYASGDDKNSFNFAVNYLNKTGVVPQDKYNRTTARLSATRTYGMFHAEVTGGYSHSNTSTYGGGYDGNPTLDGGNSLLSALLNTPSWVPLQNYKNTSAKFADVNTFYNSYGVNPYWIIQNSRYNSTSDNFNGNFAGTLTPTKWFDATYRLATNFGIGQRQYTRSQVNFSGYAHSDPTGGNGTEASAAFGVGNNPVSIPGQVSNYSQFGDGSLSVDNAGAGPQGFGRIQQDAVLNFHHTFFNDFKANLLVGNSIWQESYSAVGNSSTNLLVDGFYNIGSILGVPSTTQTSAKIRQIAYFTALNLGYKDFAFVEATMRNDHDSRLSAAVRSFFYPSVKGSLVLTQAINALHDNPVLSFAKVRASYSKVGDVNIAPYSINNTYAPTGGFPYGATGGLSLNSTLNNPSLKPESTKEFETGLDLGFLNNRINTAITYYNSSTTNQTLAISTSPSTGYSNTLINVGEVQNKGYEFKLDLEVLTKAENHVGVTLGGNLAINDSKVVSLSNGLKQITLGGYTNAAVQAVVGQAYPVLYGTDVNRDAKGRVIVDAITGNPTLNPNLVNLGRTTPKYILGLTQSVSYKFMTLNIVSEFRCGNVIYNQGLLQATAAGVSSLSAITGRQRFVFPNSVTVSGGVSTPNKNITTSNGDINFFDSGAYYNAASTYVTSGAFWKLREANLSFDLTSFVKGSIIKRASFSLNGRNLLMLRPKSNNWTDPEFANTSGNAVGINANQMPPTRIYGANLNITF